MIANSNTDWGWPAKLLHWIGAILIVLLLVHGWWMTHMAARPDRLAHYTGHAALGYDLLALLILSGLASLIAFSRLGIQRFWTPEERQPPVLRRLECVPIIALLGLSILLTFKAEPLMRFTQAAANTLNNPEQYVMAVLGTRAVPSPEAQAAAQEVQP